MAAVLFSQYPEDFEEIWKIKDRTVTRRRIGKASLWNGPTWAGILKICAAFCIHHEYGIELKSTRSSRSDFLLHYEESEKLLLSNSKSCHWRKWVHFTRSNSRQISDASRQRQNILQVNTSNLQPLIPSTTPAKCHANKISNSRTRSLPPLSRTRFWASRSRRPQMKSKPRIARLRWSTIQVCASLSFHHTRSEHSTTLG